MPSGYSGTPLAKKLGIKEGMKLILINEPGYYLNLFDHFPEVIKAGSNESDFDFIHLFVLSQKELEDSFYQYRNKLSKSGIFWVSWPKKASKIHTDLDGNITREHGLNNGLVDVKVCAIDDTWSGLKFMYRVKDR